MKQMIHSFKQALTTPSYWFAAALTILCVALHYAGLSDNLRFDRQAIDNGAWWLLLSGNFVHLGESHLWMNMAGLGLVVALVWGHFSAKQWLLITIFSSVVVGIGLYFLDDEVQWYVGFSGSLHGLIIAGVIRDIKIYPKSACLLLTLIIGKLVWEQVAGALPGSEAAAGGRVVVNAHLYGAIAGAVIAGILALLTPKPEFIEHTESDKLNKPKEPNNP